MMDLIVERSESEVDMNGWTDETRIIRGPIGGRVSTRVAFQSMECADPMANDLSTGCLDILQDQMKSRDK